MWEADGEVKCGVISVRVDRIRGTVEKVIDENESPRELVIGQNPEEHHY